MNPLLLVDYYKTEHHRQYPEGTTMIYSNFTPRKSRIPGVDKVVFFGLQHFILEYLINRFNRDFFYISWDYVESVYKKHITVSTDHIKALHDLGYLPIEIKSLEEGTQVPIGVPCFTIKNTLPEFYWLTNYLETLISCMMWQPITSATIAYEYKKILTKYALETGGDPAFVQWQGHDFSMRGMSSVESAILSGMGHLTSFTGTDTIPAIYQLEESYSATGLIGASVPATEHSVMCMGVKENEVDTFRTLLNKYPTGILSVVSDTWDLWKVCTEYLPVLKDEILARDGKLVIRPDSGDPVDIICGKPKEYEEFSTLEEAKNNFADRLRCNQVHGEASYFIERKRKVKVGLDFYELEEDTEWNRYDKQYYFVERLIIKHKQLPSQAELPESKGVIELLWGIFGGTIVKGNNGKDYKVLDSHIGAIYGDSITINRARTICERLKAKGFASTNITFGVGSYTYQMNTRDTFGFAMKATYGEVNGVGREIFKDPITDDGTKKSKKGLLRVGQHENGNLFVQDQCTWEEEGKWLLKTVFKDGLITRTTTLGEIRSKLSV